MTYWIRRSKFGYALRAIREAEQTAELSGVDTLRAKMKAYMISAFFLGMIGGIETYWLTYITPHMVFDVLITIQMVVMSLLGGMGTVFGPVVGASFLTILYELLHRDFPVYLCDYCRVYHCRGGPSHAQGDCRNSNEKGKHS